MTRFRHRKAPPSDRFLGTYHYAPPQNTATIPSTTSTEETELNEDDIFSTGDFSESSFNHHRHNDNGGSSNDNNINSPPSSTSSTPRNHFHHHHHHHQNSSNLSPNHKAFQPAESSGILAALPENKSDSVHHVYQKTTVPSSSSASSTSSSRLIPLIPKPPQERVPLSASVSRYHQHHSAPVNVPVLSMAMRGTRDTEFDEIDEDAEEADGEMLPPHEIVARAQSPAVAFSVLEGVGRTLKGRDLKQVRNAVWRRTGFLD